MANGVPHPAGSAFRYVYGGGGGWGDPTKRDPELVLDDVYDELVSLESAERDYGVVFSGSLELGHEGRNSSFACSPGSGTVKIYPRAFTKAAIDYALTVR